MQTKRCNILQISGNFLKWLLTEIHVMNFIPWPVLKKKNVSPHAPRIVDIKKLTFKNQKKKNDLSYIIALMIDLVVTC